KITNGSSKKATISAWNAQAPGGAIINTVLTAYDAKPTTDEQLKACDKGAGDYCPTTKVPCGDATFGALLETTAVVVPAGGSKLVAITSYNPTGTVGQVTEGPLMFSVRTDTLE